MNYSKFKSVSIKLLSKFGTVSNISLKQDTGETTYNETTGVDEKVYKTYSGYGVKLQYATEVIGSGDNIIKAGDVKIICVFDVEPTENNDKIVFGSDTFNVVHLGKVDPDATVTVMYTCQCRRAS